MAVVVAIKIPWISRRMRRALNNSLLGALLPYCHRPITLIRFKEGVKNDGVTPLMNRSQCANELVLCAHGRAVYFWLGLMVQRLSAVLQSFLKCRNSQCPLEQGLQHPARRTPTDTHELVSCFRGSIAVTKWHRMGAMTGRLHLSQPPLIGWGGGGRMCCSLLCLAIINLNYTFAQIFSACTAPFPDTRMAGTEISCYRWTREIFLAVPVLHWT